MDAAAETAEREREAPPAPSISRLGIAGLKARLYGALLLAGLKVRLYTALPHVVTAVFCSNSA